MLAPVTVPTPLAIAQVCASFGAIIDRCLSAQAALAAKPTVQARGLRLAARGLRPLTQLAARDPAQLPATIACIQRVDAAADAADRAGSSLTIDFLAVRLTCQTHLTRILLAQPEAGAPTRRAPAPPTPAELA